MKNAILYIKDNFNMAELVREICISFIFFI